ncbi:MAG: FG-GAP-like repeat-containing protein [Acidobacteriota bacterium]
MRKLIFFLFLLGLFTLANYSTEKAKVAGFSENWQQNALHNIKKSEYNITYQNKTCLKDLKSAYQAPNRANNFRTYFTEQETILVPRREENPSWEFRMFLKNNKSSKCSISAKENKISINRGNISEEYTNSERGLEHKLKVFKKEKSNNSSLLIEIGFKGNLKPLFSKNGNSIAFFEKRGFQVLHIEAVAKDSDGNYLPCTLEASNGGAKICVEDKNAVYPIEILNLLSYPSWLGEVNQEFSKFGYSVASAGDVNGDGYDDVIIGAPFYDNGQLDEGAAFAFYSSPSGLPSTPNWMDESNMQNFQFGLAVSTAGDVNGDGYSDVIVSQITNANEGAVHLYYGSASGLSLTSDWTGTPNQLNAWYGCSISTAGDINGDGYSDIIIGAERYDGSLTYDEGAAFVYYGSASGLSQNPDWLVTSGQGNSYFGCSVSIAGDVNGDGYSDVIVGAKYWDNPSYTDEGQAFVYYGSASGLSTTADWVGKPNYAYSLYGCSVSTAGDVNGDGYSDIIVGAEYRYISQNREGAAYVYYGSPSGLSTLNWLQSSNVALARFGNSVSCAGDVNGDGYSDVVIGAINYTNGEANEGAAYLYLGSKVGLSTSPDWMIEGGQESAEMGCSVASAGDVNGDGFSDLLIGADRYTNGDAQEGAALLFYGSASGFLPSSEIIREGGQADAQMGNSVAFAGDVNGDGYCDVIVGAPYYDNGQSDEGAAFLFYGSSNGLSSIPSWIGEKDQDNSNYGYAVSSAGDINGDGYCDVIVSAPAYDFKKEDEGAVFVYYGSPTGLSSAEDWQFVGGKDYSYLGVSVATAGDINGDGYSDVIIGAPYYENGEAQEGAVFVFNGSSAGLSSSYGWMSESNQANSYYGFSVSTAGDVNGDGYSDIIVGSYNYSEDQNREGKVFVYYGSSAGLPSTPNWTAESNQSLSQFGYSVSTAGDVNGDGYSDIVVGARSFTNAESNEGAVFVYYGSANGLPQNYDWMNESNIIGCRYGHSVSSAGDINGDGYSDLIVGVLFYSNGELNEGAVFVFYGSSSGLPSTYSYLTESNSENSLFGYSVSGSGDINGDGYSDVVIGAKDYTNGESYEGAVFALYGNEKRSKTIEYLQLRPDTSSPIFPPLLTMSPNSLMLKFLGSPDFGRAIGKAQIEAKPYGEPFDGTNLYEGQWTNLSTTGANFSEIVSGLVKNSLYKWRARVKYLPKYGLQTHSRWFYIQTNSLNEADFRTGFGPPPDTDGDGYNDEIDCNPLDNTVWASPSDVINFFINKENSDNLFWSAPTAPGCLSPVYDVLRSNSPSDFSSATCISSNIQDLAATDLDIPANVFYYLIRVENGCGSNLGSDSNGNPRSGINCP